MSQEENTSDLVKGGEFRRIMHYFERKSVFIGALFMAFVCGALPTVVNILMGQMTELLTTSKDFMDGITTLVIYMVIYDIVHSLCMLTQFALIGNAGPYFVNDIRRALYRHFMALDIEFFDQNQTGTLISRLTHDCALMNEVFISRTAEAVMNVTQAVAGVILSLVISWRITLCVIVAIPICMIAFLVGERFINKIWETFNQSTSNAGTKAEQVINAFRTVKSFDNEMWEAAQYRKSLGEIQDVYYRTSRIHGTKDGVIHFVMHCMIMGFQYLCCWSIVKKPSWGTENGDIMILMASLIFAIIGVSQVLSIGDQYKKAIVSAAQVLKILDTPIKVNQREGPMLEKPLQGKVEFKDVKFKYAGCEEYALNGLTLTIEPGETVAFIGESGCGKSTTLQLLQRFYEVESGEILVDGMNITSMSPKSLRENISIVPQGPVLFSMSIKDNIRYARPEANDQEVNDAAKLGNAHEFIMTMPDNYKTFVEPTSLSGGQKQRICISRAILTHSPILLLDEATAALDTESERLVQQSLETIRKGKTAILVAHRLATVMNADRIFVMKEGRVIEEGNHQTLMEKNGAYADLVKFQLQ